MAKKINLNALEKATKKQYVVGSKEVLINGEPMTFHYDTSFRDSKVRDMLLEWLAIKESTVDVEDINLTDVLMVMQIKYFTDIEFVKYDNHLTQVMHYAKMGNRLFDLKSDSGENLFQIVMSCFREEDINKVANQMQLLGSLLAEEMEKANVTTETI